MAKDDLTTIENSDFDLKHRITGAAVLIIFAVLILPWLLGPPNEPQAKGLVEAEQNAIQTLSGELEQTEPELLTFDDVEETVYISKITPLSELNQETELVESVDESAKGPETQPSETDTNDQLSNRSNGETRSKDSSEKKNSIPSTSEREAQLQAQLNQEAAQLEQKQETNTDSEPKEIKPVEFIPPKQDPISTKPSNTVEVGWVVQVGLFRDKNRAAKLISDLRKSGFSASSTVVDTNRGANTGTRVWLGPFSKQASAHEELKRLKRVAGKEGFVRVYP